MNLRETQRTSKLNIGSLKINVNDIMLVLKGAQTFLERDSESPSRDSEIRRAIVKIAKTNTILKRPVNKLFTVENIYHDTNQRDKASHRKIAFPFPSCPVNDEYS